MFASWGPLGDAVGALLGRLRGLLGRLEAILDVLERSLGPSWTILKASLDPPGPCLGLLGYEKRHARTRDGTRKAPRAPKSARRGFVPLSIQYIIQKTKGRENTLLGAKARWWI